MQQPRIWILGAPDPEMQAIDNLLRDCGETVLHAVDERGERVHPGNAYRASSPRHEAIWLNGVYAIYAVECAWAHHDGEYGDLTTIDHHRAGDPGFGRPPSQYWAASSIGQVYAELRRLGLRAGGAPEDLLMLAAADHCLGAAYSGDCPGVDPDALMRWRAESRARFQGRGVDEVLADIEVARRALESAPVVDNMIDLRGQHVPELPDAASRYGYAYVTTVTTDGSGRACRPKVVLGGRTTLEMVRAFLDHWAPSQGLVDCYGDPARGFAGGYHVVP